MFSIEREYRYPLPVSVLWLFRVLAMGHFTPHDLWKSRTHRTKFVVRVLLMPISSYQLFNIIIHHPHYQHILQVQPRLPCKLHYPYVSVCFNRSQKVKALEDHYHIIQEVFPPTVLGALFNCHPVCLGNIEGKNGIRYDLKLVSLQKTTKEGDLSVTMSVEGDIILTMCTFSLLNYQGKRTLFVGGLQGHISSLSREKTREATKACYGLFPKRLVFEVICQLAVAVGCQSIMAVGNNTHIYNCWRYRKKRKEILADYDAFWLSINGVRDLEGHFRLPLNLGRKTQGSIPSKKRAEYRRRYQLLDEVCQAAKRVISI